MREQSMFNRMYFEGYRRCVTMDDAGRMRVEFVYEGVYYKPQMNRRAALGHKAACTAVPAVALAGLIAVMTLRTDGNALGYMTLAQVLCLFMLGLSLVCGAVRAAAGGRMTEWEYRMGVLSVKELNLVGLLGAAFLAIAEIVLLARGQTASPGAEALCCAAYVLLAVVQLALLRLVGREHYDTQESEDVLKGVDVTADVTPPQMKEEWR